ncbi:MAG: (Fe-S)-binding protein [Candidatus Nezhaarchaeales archaeon]
MKTAIGIVGSTREARLRLMSELGDKLGKEGYSVLLVFRDYDYNYDYNSPKITLVMSTIGSSIFIRANFRVSLDDVKSLIPGRWCLALIDGFEEDPYIVAAVSMSDVKKFGLKSMAIVPMTEKIEKEIEGPWKYKVMRTDDLIGIVRERLIKDILNSLAQDNCGQCGFSNCRELAEAIAKGEGTLLKCAKRKENVKLIVNGENVQLNQFTSKVLVQMLQGLVSILKGVPRNLRKIHLEVSLD